MKRRTAAVSKWLHDADGSEVNYQNKESNMASENIGESRYDGRSSRRSGSEENSNKNGNLDRRIWSKGDSVNQQNPNLIPLGIRKDFVTCKMGQSSSRAQKESNWVASDKCLLSLGQEEEHSPLFVLEGKKKVAFVRGFNSAFTEGICNTLEF